MENIKTFTIYELDPKKKIVIDEMWRTDKESSKKPKNLAKVLKEQGFLVSFNGNSYRGFPETIEIGKPNHLTGDYNPEFDKASYIAGIKDYYFPKGFLFVQ
jgi:ribosomal protein S8